jgi:hypothetical protein
VSPERQPPPSSEQNLFGFTEHERLVDRISHHRLLAIIEDPQTAILKAEVSSNTFGEFLFVSTKRAGGEKPAHITFWGLGFHEPRERWLFDEWAWYDSNPDGQAEEPSLTNADVVTLITERRAEIAPEIGQQVQSARGRLYELLAELTDEDGALTELEDLGDLLDDDDFLL